MEIIIRMVPAKEAAAALPRFPVRASLRLRDSLAVTISTVVTCTMAWGVIVLGSGKRFQLAET